MDSDIVVKSVECQYTPEEARFPLKFGAVVVPECLFCTVKAIVENRNGDVAEGYGGIFLMDMWAWPNPDLDHPKKVATMKEITEGYSELVEGHSEPAHPVDIFFDLEDDLRRLNLDICRQNDMVPPQPYLGALVCASPVDGAIHDAFGKVNGIDTYDGYGPQFAPDLSKWLGEGFEGKYIADYIRDEYQPRLPIFHLVGGLDKLTVAELDEDDPDDGLPNSLDEWIRRDGVYCLKVKLRGDDLDWDVQRCLDVYRIGREQLDLLNIEPLHMSADTNEQCESPDYIVEMLSKIREQSQACYDSILYIEQPTERDMTASRHDMSEIAQMKPVIVDESLTDLASFDLALELGWTGVALKSCKCHSSAMLMAAKAREAGIEYSIQDLTNPSIALLHSVGMGARLYPIMGVEANSRQFFPEATKDAQKQIHGDMFQPTRGEVSTKSLQGDGLGYRMDEMKKLGLQVP
ncbi:MAG: enolase C-terminal domain-like protein [Armatimonadota bacterium]